MEKTLRESEMCPVIYLFILHSTKTRQQLLIYISLKDFTRHFDTINTIYSIPYLSLYLFYLFYIMISQTKILSNSPLSIPQTPKTPTYVILTPRKHSVPDSICRRLFRFRQSTNSPRNASILAASPLVLPRNVDLWAEFKERAALLGVSSYDPWKSVLIDWFYSLAPLSVDNGYNFIRASYALDVCVKLYSIRIELLCVSMNAFMNDFNTMSNYDRPNQPPVNEPLKSKIKKRNIANSPSPEARRPSPSPSPLSISSPVTERSASRDPSRRKSTLRTIAKDFNEIRLKKLPIPPVNDSLYLKKCDLLVGSSPRCMMLNCLDIDDNGLKIFDMYSTPLVNDDFSMEEMGEERDNDLDFDSKQVNLKRVYQNYFLKGGGDENILETMTISASIQKLEKRETISETTAKYRKSLISNLPTIPEPIYDNSPENIQDGYYNYNYDSDAEISIAPFRDNSPIPQDPDLDLDPNLGLDIDIDTDIPLNTSRTESSFVDSMPAFFPQDDVSSPVSPAPSEHWRIQRVKYNMNTRSSKRHASIRRQEAAEMYDLNRFLSNADQIDFSETGQDIDLLEVPTFSTATDDDMYLIPAREFFASSNLNQLIEMTVDSEIFEKMFLKPRVLYKDFTKAVEASRESISAGTLCDDENYNSFECGSSPKHYEDIYPNSFGYGGDMGGYEESGSFDQRNQTLETGEEAEERPMSRPWHSRNNMNFAKSSANVDFKRFKGIMKNILDKILQAQTINASYAVDAFTTADVSRNIDMSQTLIVDEFSRSITPTYDDPQPTLQETQVELPTLQTLVKQANLTYQNQAFLQTSTPEKESDYVSLACCFFTLLALANENGYSLISTPDCNDVIINTC